MILLAKPDISSYLSKTLSDLQVPVVLTEAMKVPMQTALNIHSPQFLKENKKLAYRSPILTNSENALHTLFDIIPHDDRSMKSKLFKNKVAFREALAKSTPEFFFKKFQLSELSTIQPNSFPFPLIMKPSVGISSIGVKRIESAEQWIPTVEYLKSELNEYSKNYAAQVVESQEVILEQFIEGTELAIDGYFNKNADPIILNILEHPFLNNDDTSDRIYTTQRSIIQKYYPLVLAYLKEFGEIFDLKQFPFHLELRHTPNGKLIPIELNPLRFSGLGTTELSEFAYGINVYKHFFQETAPNWESILQSPDQSYYSFMCADIPTALFRKKGLRILDRELFKSFKEVLEYRFLSESETSTFAVIFFRSESYTEIENFLKMDFSQFCKI